MARRPREQAASSTYHVLNRGVDRQPIFFDDVDRIEFGRRLRAMFEDFGVVTYAYCLMTNHYHLMLYDPERRLSEAMHAFASTYVRRTNDRVGRDGPMFRDRFRSIPVTTEAYFVWLSRYIHRNPLAIGGIHRPADYRWSSFRTYLGQRPCPVFLDREPVLERFGGSVDRFAEFTDSRSYQQKLPRQADELVDFINLAVNLEAISNESGAPSHADCTLRALLIDAGYATDPERSPSALRNALCRARKRRNSDPAIARMFAGLQTMLDAAA